jgi:hypothetical protein
MHEVYIREGEGHVPPLDELYDRIVDFFARAMNRPSS